MKKQLSQKTITYLLFGGVVFLLITSIAVTLMLRADSTTAPIATTRVRASTLTYRKTIFIVNVTPTQAITEETPIPTITQANEEKNSTKSAQIAKNNNSSSEEQNATGSGRLTGTTTPTKTKTPTLTRTPTPTTDSLAEDDSASSSAATATKKPTSASQLPESGNWNYTIVMFISATVFLFVSFIF